MARLIVLNGPPAAGKSTLAALYAERHRLTLNLDVDLVRAQLGGWRDAPGEAGLPARAVCVAAAGAHLRGGHDVIVAQLVARPGFLEDPAAAAARAGAGFHEVVLLDSPAALADRLAERTRRAPAPCVPEPVVRSRRTTTCWSYWATARGERLGPAGCRSARPVAAARMNVRRAWPCRWVPQHCPTASDSHPVVPDAQAPAGPRAESTADGTADPSAGVRRAAAASPGRPRTCTLLQTRWGTISEIDERTTQLLGWAAGALVGLRWLDTVHPDDRGRVAGGWAAVLSGGAIRRMRLRQRRAGGDWLWVEAELRLVERDGPVRVGVLLVDIAEEMAAHEAFDRQALLFRRLSESLPIGVLQLAADYSFVYANERFATFAGATSTGSVREYLEHVAEPDRPGLLAALDLMMRTGADGRTEVDFDQPDGSVRRCAIRLITLTDREGAPGGLVCLRDITEATRMAAELEIKATVDPLTGCHNRSSIMTVLERELAVGQGTRTGVIFIDLDQFKPVNDRFGHAAGDELLVHTASRLAGCVRAGDMVGRLGGDEFLLVCPALEGAAEVRAIGERVRTALHGTVTLAAGEVTMGASIGLAVSETGATCDSLVAQADAAMYRSKRDGAGRPVLAAGEDQPTTGGRP